MATGSSNNGEEIPGDSVRGTAVPITFNTFEQLLPRGKLFGSNLIN